MSRLVLVRRFMWVRVLIMPVCPVLSRVLQVTVVYGV